MTRFLDVNRRISGWGIVFLFLFLYLKIERSDLDSELAVIQAFYLLYFLISPILYLLYAIISVAYFRKHGDYEYTFQEHSPFTNFFMCLGMDLAAPFKNIGGFIIALIDKTAEERNKRIHRFVEMMLFLLFCGIGLLVQLF